MMIIVVARKFGTKYHHWAYGPYNSQEDAFKDARECGFTDYIVIPLLESPELVYIST